MHRIEIKQVLGAKDWFYVAVCCECEWFTSNLRYSRLEEQALEHGAVA